MRWTKRLIELSSEALGRTLDFEHPADAVLSQFFRENPKLGHAERGVIAETVYLVLRRLRVLEAAVGHRTRRELVLAALFCLRGHNLRELEPALDRDEALWLGGIRGRFLQNLSAAQALDLPDWLYEAWVVQWGEEEVAALSKALNQPGPLDLRVNTLRGDRAAVLARIQAAGLKAELTPYSPLGIRVEGKPFLSRFDFFQDGSIEVQDEGSQLLGLLLGPKRGEMVVDFCAGAGGKTLMLGAQMRSTGRLYAFDVSDKRLSNLKPRLKRSGLSNVYPIRIEHERDARVKRLAGKIDRVLVDAPCSGLGTLRRNPDLKWRQTPEAVARLVDTQKSIIAAAADVLKPGGRLVYATCSLLAAENEAVVQGFLADRPDFKSLSAEDVLSSMGVNLPLGERLQLLPHRHGTDGFFAAVLERA